MTNLQLLLSIGIPSLLILISLFNNNSRFNSLETRIAALEGRMTALEGRMTAVETRLERLLVIESDLRRFFEILGAHGEAIDTLKKRS